MNDERMSGMNEERKEEREAWNNEGKENLGTRKIKQISEVDLKKK